MKILDQKKCFWFLCFYYIFFGFCDTLWGRCLSINNWL